MKKNARFDAVHVMQNVLRGRSLDVNFSEPFVQALCYEACRWYFQLEALLAKLLEKPLKNKDDDVRLLLLLGLCQLIHMQIPPHAAVAETVAVCSLLNKDWAKGLVNAVLRNYLRRKPAYEHHAHPPWLAEKIQADWPAQAAEIFAANNQHPPLILRVNLQKISRADYLAKLPGAQALADTAAGIVLANPVNVSELPGFLQGEVSVQDATAQLAATLLEPQPGDHILDACAAPGGKTAHLMEYQPALASLTAIDQDEKRLARVAENLTRLGLAAKLVAADAAAVASWWEGVPFDRILLDAPCSASGVIRRHPDIKLLRRAADIPVLAATQLRLLTALWPLLKIGGRLLYVTCSIFQQENAEVLAAFMAQHADAIEKKIDVTAGVACKIGKQWLPGMNQGDGFYYACLEKGK